MNSKPTRRWAYVTSAIAGVLLALVCYLPARWFAPLASNALDGKIEFQDVRGSVWFGSASVTAKPNTSEKGAEHAVNAMSVSWDIRPQWVGLRGVFRVPCCSEKGIEWGLKLSPTSSDLSIKNSDFQLPDKALQRFATPFNALGLDGDIRLTTSDMHVVWNRDGQVRVIGRAQIDALGISTRLTQLRPVGSYRLTYSGSEPNQMEMSTLSGPLKITGTGKWTGQTWAFRGVAAANEGYETALVNVLNILGKTEENKTLISIGTER